MSDPPGGRPVPGSRLGLGALGLVALLTGL
jgi:hypothetical protein